MMWRKRCDFLIVFLIKTVWLRPLQIDILSEKQTHQIVLIQILLLA